MINKDKNTLIYCQLSTFNCQLNRIFEPMAIRTFLLIGTVLICNFLVNAQGIWERIEVPTDQSLHSVYFTDSIYGWAVGDTGTIIHTKDGGDTWTIQDPGTDNNFWSVFFLDREMGWAISWNFVGFFGTLIHNTIDGGETWTSSQYTESSVFMNSILYLDSLNGWMGGSPHAIVRTNDGGTSWTQAAVDTTPLAFFPVLKIQFYDDTYGYACGGMFDIAGVTWSTSDGGETWHPIDNLDAPADEVHGMHLFDSVRVLGAGGDPDFGYGVGMLRTNDGGINWNYEELSMQGNAYDIDFRTGTEAWAPLGPRQKLIYSLDAGDSWTEINTPDSTAIFEMIFPDSLHGYGVGDHGAFIRYDATSVGLLDPPEEKMRGFQAYPNPCTNQLTIRCQIPDTRYRMIEIYTIEGRIVDRLEISFEDKRELDVSHLPAGIFFIKLTTENQISIRKLIKH